MTTRKLTERQRRFVEAYMADPNGTKAARVAGYKGNDNTLHSIATENLRKPAIRAAIGARVKEDPRVMTREQRQVFWSEVTRGEIKGFDGADRLRASALLGKAQGDFVKRIEITGDMTVRVPLRALTTEELETVTAAARIAEAKKAGVVDFDNAVPSPPSLGHGGAAAGAAAESESGDDRDEG